MEKKICDSEIAFGDDFGDNSCTFHCQLPANHEGKHKESGNMYGLQKYEVFWEDVVKETSDEEFCSCEEEYDVDIIEFEPPKAICTNCKKIVK